MKETHIYNKIMNMYETNHPALHNLAMRIHDRILYKCKENELMYKGHKIAINRENKTYKVNSLIFDNADDVINYIDGKGVDTS
jgi:hypothetical protein